MHDDALARRLIRAVQCARAGSAEREEPMAHVAGRPQRRGVGERFGDGAEERMLEARTAGRRAGQPAARKSQERLAIRGRLPRSEGGLPLLEPVSVRLQRRERVAHLRPPGGACDDVASATLLLHGPIDDHDAEWPAEPAPGPVAASGAGCDWRMTAEPEPGTFQYRWQVTMADGEQFNVSGYYELQPETVAVQAPVFEATGALAVMLAGVALVAWTIRPLSPEN